MKLRIATRRSKLALAQTRWVAEQVRANHPDVEIEEVHVVTQGDRVLDTPLFKVGGKGLFVTDVETALLEGKADLAVHSMKDLPAQLAPGLEIVCVPEREDPRDVLVANGAPELDDLEAGSRIGTSSLRRTCQLRARRSDLAFEMLRGNVDTRLRKLDEGKFSAVVLAYAGLKRLGIDRPLWPIPVEISLPAAGQGALALEARPSDDDTLELLAELQNERTRIEIEAERAVVACLGASCQVPVAAYARFDDQSLRVRVDGLVGSLDGSQILSAGTDEFVGEGTLEERLEAARRLGSEIGKVLLEQGADEILERAELASFKGM